MDPLVAGGIASAATLILREVFGLVGTAFTKYRQGRVEDSATVLEDHRRVIKDQREEINQRRKEADEARCELEDSQKETTEERIARNRAEARIEYLQDLLREAKVNFRPYQPGPPSGTHLPLTPSPQKEPPP